VKISIRLLIPQLTLAKEETIKINFLLEVADKISCSDIKPSERYAKQFQKILSKSFYTKI